jgi:hypothetical protein
MISMALAPFGAGSGGHLAASQTANPSEPQCSTVKEAHELGMQARTWTGNDAWARTGFKSKVTPESAPSAVQEICVMERIIVSVRRIAGTRA